MDFVLLVLSIFLHILPHSTLCDNQGFTRLENKAVHTFQNRHDSGVIICIFLTAINVRTPSAAIVTDEWRDSATQKWRDISAIFSNAYQLKPISNEDKEMNYDPYTGLVYQEDVSFLNLGSTGYWQLVYVGQSYHLIKNYKDGRCLSSSDLGQPVVVSECSSIPRQQWQILRL